MCDREFDHYWEMIKKIVPLGCEPKDPKQGKYCG